MTRRRRAGPGPRGGVLTGRTLSSFLFQISPHDPAALTAAVGLLGAVGLVAILAAARRALAVDPVEAIRAE